MSDEGQDILAEVSLTRRTTAKDISLLVRLLNGSRYELEYVHEPAADEPDFYLLERETGDGDD